VIDKVRCQTVLPPLSGPGGSSLDGSGTPQGSFNVNDDDIAIDTSAVQPRSGSSTVLNANARARLSLEWRLLLAARREALSIPTAGFAESPSITGRRRLGWPRTASFKALRRSTATRSPPALIGLLMANQQPLCRLNVDAARQPLQSINTKVESTKLTSGGVPSRRLSISRRPMDVAVESRSAISLATSHHPWHGLQTSTTHPGLLYKTFGTNMIGDGRGIAYNEQLHSDRCLRLRTRASNPVKVFGPSGERHCARRNDRGEHGNRPARGEIQRHDQPS
jgi:hypothetical protein